MISKIIWIIMGGSYIQPKIGAHSSLVESKVTTADCKGFRGSHPLKNEMMHQMLSENTVYYIQMASTQRFSIIFE